VIFWYLTDMLIVPMRDGRFSTANVDGVENTELRMKMTIELAVLPDFFPVWTIKREHSLKRTGLIDLHPVQEMVEGDVFRVLHQHVNGVPIIACDLR
jgi:hypothetical protein